MKLGGQARPQPPQLLGSPAINVSQPLAGLPSQLAKPAWQAAMTQVPFEQALEAFGRLQTCPQAPQLLGSFAMLVSQPSAYWPLQSRKPGLQAAMKHVPPEQAGVPFGTGEQGRPQAPQLLTSLLRFVSQPLDTLLSQLPKPALQVI